MEFAEPTNFIQFALYKGTSTTILTFISLTPPPPHPFLSGQHCLEVYADWPRVGSLIVIEPWTSTGPCLERIFSHRARAPIHRKPRFSAPSRRVS